MTVLEIIQRSTDYLARKGVESPRLQVELLLAHVLAMPRLQLYLNFQREIAEPELARLRDLVKRRGQREPLQYIVGTTSFCGTEIKCTSAALIPRPETELLAERAWQFLDGLAVPTPTALDIGTGSGCIAIAIAAEVPRARLVAVDLSVDALSLAHENATANKVGERIEFRHGDAFACPETVGAPGKFDLIVSNPPYIPSAEVDGLEPEIRGFEPRLALDGGPDGLGVFRRMAAQAKAWLNPGGKIMLEFSHGQAEPMRMLFEKENWVVEQIVPDYSSHLRIFIAHPEQK